MLTGCSGRPRSPSEGLMRRFSWKTIFLASLIASLSAIASLHAQQPAPDLILSNGKIITVDPRFTIAQAVAIRGERIVAVGTSQEIGHLAGPSTRKIDLKGKSVIPG